MRSTAVGTSIDMTIVARIGLTIVARIGTAITRPTLLTVAPAGRACGHPTGGAASMCAATSARTADIGTATSARPIGTAIIVRTADLGTVAILARPMDVARAITEPNDKCGCPSSSPARHAGEPSRSLTAPTGRDSNSGRSAAGKSTVPQQADAPWQSRASSGFVQANDLVENALQCRPCFLIQVAVVKSESWKRAPSNYFTSLFPVIFSKFPWKIFSCISFARLSESSIRSVSRIYPVPFSGSNGQSEANNTFSVG